MLEYSIADAKTHLPRIIHEAEKMGTVHLTRYGKPVAVILSEIEYTALKHKKHTTTKQALLSFLENKELKDIDIDTTVFDRNRAEHSGREIQL